MPHQPLIPFDQIGAPRQVRGGVPQKYFLDDRGRRLIMDLYDGSQERIELIKKHLPGIPTRVISKWAIQMGKVSPRDFRKWTPEQEKFLCNNLRTMPMSKLEKHLRKERSTIVRKAKELGLYREDKEDGHSIDSLAMALGITNDNKIKHWVDRGWLKGEKQTTAFKTVKWYFTDKAVRDFIFAHPQEINPHKVDWLWVVDILAGDRGIGRLDADKYTDRTR